MCLVTFCSHRLCPMVVQFVVSGAIYFLLLLLTLGEEFKHCPAPLQSVCCWVHENKSARMLLTLTAITVNFGIASADIVSLILFLSNQQLRYVIGHKYRTIRRKHLKTKQANILKSIKKTSLSALASLL